jgi:hypothetical protein
MSHKENREPHFSSLSQNVSHSKRKWLVAFRPAMSGMDGDKLFRDEQYVHIGDASHWMEPIRQLARFGACNGYEFHTEDMVDLGKTDVLILGDVLMTPKEVAELRTRYPQLRIILQILETPFGRTWTFDPANHQCFDAVVTYNDRLFGKSGYFIYKIPTGGLESWEKRPRGLPWEGRKTVCMVAGAPRPRQWIFRRKSGLGMLRAGWRFSPATWWNYVTDGGYINRLSVASSFVGILPGELDIYGPKWDGVGNAAIRAAWRGPWLGSKLELLGRYKFNIAYENCLNDVGYISEKIFDAFLAGTVPVYLGNQRIQEFVPAESFVDAREFKSVQELGTLLKAMSRQQWEAMRVAGDEFLRTGAEEHFGAAQYARAVIAALTFLMSRIS